MKKQWILPLTAVLGGVTAFILRLLQRHTGFESDTGLPIPGNPAGILLVVLLAALAAVLILLVRQLPKETESGPPFPDVFTTNDAKLFTLPVMGVFFIALSGLADLYEGFGMGSLLLQIAAAGDGGGTLASSLRVVTPGFSAKAQILMAILSIASAAGLFVNLLACRRRDGVPVSSANGNLLLIPSVSLVVRLVLTYRIDSVDPTLTAYYVELLALVFLCLGFYRLSSFAFRAGRTRPFALYSGAAVILCITALADGSPYLSSILIYIGGALTLLGFLLLRLAFQPADGQDD